MYKQQRHYVFDDNCLKQPLILVLFASEELDKKEEARKKTIRIYSVMLS